jgi:hypothetical protein
LIDVAAVGIAADSLGGTERVGYDHARLSQLILSVRHQRRSSRLTMLAEMYLELGDYGAAEETVSGTFKLVNRTNERFWEPEVYRVAGEIKLSQAGWKPRCRRRAVPRGDQGAAHQRRARN